LTPRLSSNFVCSFLGREKLFSGESSFVSKGGKRGKGEEPALAWTLNKVKKSRVPWVGGETRTSLDCLASADSEKRKEGGKASHTTQEGGDPPPSPKPLKGKEKRKGAAYTYLSVPRKKQGEKPYPQEKGEENVPISVTPNSGTEENEGTYPQRCRGEQTNGGSSFTFRRHAGGEYLNPSSDAVRRRGGVTLIIRGPSQ